VILGNRFLQHDTGQGNNGRGRILSAGTNNKPLQSVGGGAETHCLADLFAQAKETYSGAKKPGGSLG
jgi:hypothetical protein